MAGWRVVHVFDLGLAEEPDSVIGERAIAMGAVILTFDEDFLDSRAGLRDRLPGVVRLRVWPTRLPLLLDALERLLNEVGADALIGSAVVIDRRSIRVRPIQRRPN